MTPGERVGPLCNGTSATGPPPTAGRRCCSSTGSGTEPGAGSTGSAPPPMRGIPRTRSRCGDSPGRLRTARLGQYVDDVVATAESLPRPPVLVGHSMGGLVVQQALARYAVRAAVLVAPVPAHPAVSSLVAIARRHPLDALRIVVGGSLPLRPDYLLHELAPADAQRQTECSNT